MMFVVDPIGTWSVVPAGATLDELQEYVGGYIEYVPMPRHCPFDIIVNEEGMLRGMPHNFMASQIAMHLWLNEHEEKDLVLDMLNIVGPAIVVMKGNLARRARSKS